MAPRRPPTPPPPADVPLDSALPSRSIHDYNRVWQHILNSQQAQKYAEDVCKSAEEYCKWAASTKRRRATIITRFIEMHLLPPWDAYQNREFDEDNLLCTFSSK